MHGPLVYTDMLVLLYKMMVQKWFTKYYTTCQKCGKDYKSTVLLVIPLCFYLVFVHMLIILYLYVFVIFQYIP